MDTQRWKLDVQRKMLRGESFEAVEDFIDDLGTDDETKAALWLLAWSYLPRPYQRRVALTAINLAAPATA